MNRWSEGLAAWWDEVRGWIAFGVAPLAVPFIMVVGVGLDGTSQSELSVIAFFSLMLAYFGTLPFGLPLYLLLRAYQQTEFWLAPVVGFIAGTAMMWVIHWSLGVPLLPMAGPCGSAVGVLLWLIARPDRQRRSA